MKRILLILALLIVSCGAVHAADCGTSPPQSLGGGVTCTATNTATGSSSNINTNTAALTGQTGNGVVVLGYDCTSLCTTPNEWAGTHAYSLNAHILPTSLAKNPCGFTFIATTSGTSGSTEPQLSNAPCSTDTATVNDGGVVWTPELLTISDNINNPETCFALSSISPAPQQSTIGSIAEAINYIWYCPSLPSGVTSITLNCNVASQCDFISLFPTAFTGLCTTAPCFDGDGNNEATSGTSVTTNTTSAGYTNDLVIGIMTTQNDELETPNGGCVQVNQSAQGNLIQAKTVSGGGVQSCGATWSPSDGNGLTLVNIKSAISAPLTASPSGFGGKAAIGGKASL